MKQFFSKSNNNYNIIIGCGRLGANLANTLSDEGADVLIIDQDKNAFRKLSPSFGGLTLTGNGSDFDVLEEAQIQRADVVVIVTNNDNANIMIAQIAKKNFHVKRVISRLYDSERECVYHEFEIDTICPAMLSAREIDKLLEHTVAHTQEETA